MKIFRSKRNVFALFLPAILPFAWVSGADTTVTSPKGNKVTVQDANLIAIPGHDDIMVVSPINQLPLNISPNVSFEEAPKWEWVETRPKPMEATFSSNNHEVKVEVDFETKAKKQNGDPDDAETVTVRLLKVDVEVPEAAQDGEPSEKFKITGLPSGVTVDSYEWKWHTDHYPNAAHPNESHLPAGEFFDDKTKAEPTVPEPRWFSTTGDKHQEGEGRPALANCSHPGAPFRSNYKISCIVTIGGASFETTKVDWEVYIPQPTVSRPHLNSKRPKVSNRYLEATDEWEAYVSDRNGFARVAPSLNPAQFDTRNLFYNKIITVHESEHIDQWNNQAPWKDLYDADDLWAEINDMTVTGERTAVEPQLRQMIDSLVQDHLEASDQANDLTFHCRERKAHTLSNAVNPDFLEIDLGCGYPSSNYSCSE